MRKYKVTVRRRNERSWKRIVQKGNHRSQKVLNALVPLNCDEGRFQDHPVKNEDVAAVLENQHAQDRPRERNDLLRKGSIPRSPAHKRSACTRRKPMGISRHIS